MIGIEPIATRTFMVPASNIAVTELPEGMTAEFPDLEGPVEVEISGLSDVISTLSANTILGVISMDELKEELGVEELAEGVYNRPVSFQLPEAGIASISTFNADVLLQRKEEAQNTANTSTAADNETNTTNE